MEQFKFGLARATSPEKAIQLNADLISVEHATFSWLAQKVGIKPRIKRTDKRFLEILSSGGFIFTIYELISSKMIGYLIWQNSGRQDPRRANQISGPAVYGMSMAILPEYHRRGLGERAARECLKLVPARTIFLHVRTDNLAAIALFSKLGFREKLLLSSFYGAGTDAYLMALEG